MESMLRVAIGECGVKLNSLLSALGNGGTCCFGIVFSLLSHLLA